MKIVLLGPAHPFRGGIATFSESLAVSLKAKGHQVEIHTYTKQYPSIFFPGKTQLSQDPAPANLKITRSYSSVNPISWWTAARSITHTKPDLMIPQFWMPLMGMSLAQVIKGVKRRTKSKAIAVTHNVIPHEKRPGDQFLTSAFLNSCDGYIALSRSVLEDINQFTKQGGRSFLPHPIYDNYGQKVKKETARKELGIPQDRRLILFFGLVRKYKGLDLLIEAMADNRLQDQNIHLLVAGEFYEDEQSYRQMIAEKQVSDRVHLVPKFIANEKVKHYFSAADIVAQPYKTATQSGISQIAYNFEKPMLVTNVGGLPEIVKDGVAGYVVEQSPKEIAEKLLDFFQNNRESFFVKNVAEEKLRFSWSTFADGLLELYDQICLVDKD